MRAVLDDTLLEDADRLLDADRRGLLRAAASAGAQVRATADAAREAGLATLEGQRPRALVLLTRPGAGETVARLVATMATPICPAPVVVTPVAPPWLGPLDVVVASHAGRDGDPADAGVAEAVDRAVRRGATVVLTGPDDGPAAAAAAGRALSVVPRLPTAREELPAGLDAPTDLAAALAVTGALGVLAVDPEVLADRLDAEAERDGPRGESFVNPAKSLALRLADRTPVLWGIDPVAGALAAHVATGLAAHAGVVAHAGTLTGAEALPGLAAVVGAGGGAGGADLFADPFADPYLDGPGGPGGLPPRLLLVGVREDVATRRLAAGAAARWPAADPLELDDPDVAGDSPAAEALRAAVLATRAAFAACHLGLATGATGAAGAADGPGAGLSGVPAG